MNDFKNVADVELTINVRIDARRVDCGVWVNFENYTYSHTKPPLFPLPTVFCVGISNSI